MNKASLRHIFETHRGKVTDKWERYLDEYERLLSPFRDKPVRLLEVGVQNGGSLEIWAKYFSEAEIIVGCDIDPACAVLTYSDPRIQVVVGDVNDPQTQGRLSELSDEFNVIIDDGSHRSGDVVRSFGLLFPQLAAQGCYLIEDLHCSYWNAYEGGLFHPFSSMAFLRALTDILNRDHWGLERKPDSILAGFKGAHGLEIDNESLRQIHTIEFSDSVCAIHKLPEDKNSLGRRMISGRDATVISAEKLGSTLQDESIVPRQHINPWSNGRYPPGEDMLLKLHEIHELRLWSAKLMAELDQREAALRNDRQFESSEHRPERPAATIPAPVWKSDPGDEAFLRSTHALAERVQREKRALYKHRETTPGDSKDYEEWVNRYDRLADTDRFRIFQSIRLMADQPLLSLVVPVTGSAPESIRRTVNSVQSQLYSNWELWITAGDAIDESLRAYLILLDEENARVRVAFNDPGSLRPDILNAALEKCSGHWVTFLQPPDTLPEHALFHVARAANRNPEARLIYSDEDVISGNGIRSEPYFKCDWDRELFYGHHYLSRLGVFRRDLLIDTGGFRTDFAGAEDYDLALRCIERISDQAVHHIPKVLYHRAADAEGFSDAAPDSGRTSLSAHRQALQEHLDRDGVAAVVLSAPDGGTRVRYRLPASQPKVSLVIPTRNGLDLLRTCIESIENRTTYANYEILVVDNGSDDPATIEYLENLQEAGRIRVLHDSRPFNYAELNNAAVAAAEGELIGLINNDIEVIEEEWLTEMVGVAIQPGVGCVGAKLLYPDGTVQHAGVILGIGGVAGHAFKHMAGNSPGYFGRATQSSTFSALTGACLVFKKNVFVEAGGFDSENLAIAFNDIDFCLKVREKGYRHVLAPQALLYHHESASRGYEDTPDKKARFAREVAFMKRRWGNTLLNDPAYNPNLTLEDQRFSLAWPPRSSAQLPRDTKSGAK